MSTARDPFSIFIGFDSTQEEAYWVCRASMIQHGCDPNVIHPIVQDDLRARGLYWRNSNEKASTEFTNTRFLVPYLAGYTGRSLFCDVDFLWRCNPMELFLTDQGSYDVHVVKHDLKEKDLQPVKMNGLPQSWYPKKNWSSLMLFNNSRCRALTPEVVSSQTMDYLHQFKWTFDIKIGDLPYDYNSLVGYSAYNHHNPRAVHFTDGGPWLEGYENVAFAEEWRSVQRASEQSMYQQF